MPQESRSAPFFTVDSASTRDIDDAIRITRADDGGYRLSVAIANPLGFVPIGSPLDIQARNLAATVYMREAPLQRMLPSYVSEERSSLVADKPRNALVYEMELDANLEVVRFTPREETITVGRRLSYDEIPQVIADNTDPLHTSLLTCTELSMNLLSKRRRLGALALYDMSQLLLTDEEGNLRQHGSKAEVMGHILVQEMMILTNSQLGAYLAKENVPAIFRNHKRQVSAPESDELANIVQSWLQGDFDVSVVQSQFSAVAGKASYGSRVEGHYGLSLPVYMHATSPLRRYADLVNMRQLVAHLKGEAAPYDVEALQEISQGLNDTIARQKEARSEGYKRGLTRVISKEMAKGNLSTLANHELSAAVKIAAQEGQMPQMLEEEIVRRVDNDTLAFEVAQRLFFKVPAASRTPAVCEALARWLEKAPHRAPSLVSAGIVLNVFADQPDIETEGGSGAFRSTVTMRVRDGDTSYMASGQGAQKKLSIQRAMVAALCHGIGVQRDLDAPELELSAPAAPQPVQVAATYPPDSNPKGQLMEWCQKSKCAPPVFTHSTDGPSHRPVFGAHVSLEVAGSRHEASAQGLATKKLAEAEVSWSLLQALRGAQADKQTNPQPIKEGSNPISSLQEWCQGHDLALPAYAFQEIGGKVPSFECTVTVQTSHGDWEFSGNGGTKQQAKAQAACNALDEVVQNQRSPAQTMSM